MQHVGSSSLTRDRTQAPSIGSAESYPLDHQGSPRAGHFKREVTHKFERGRERTNLRATPKSQRSRCEGEAPPRTVGTALEGSRHWFWRKGRDSEAW